MISNAKNNSVYFKLCSKEMEISSNSKGRFSKWIDKNSDIVILVLSLIAATLSILSAYGYFPSTLVSPMFEAGWFASAACIGAKYSINNCFKN